MAMRRPASDLKKGCQSTFDVSSQDPPVSKGMGFLAVEHGEKLEMMTRTNRAIIDGLSAGYAYCARYNSAYIRDKTERIMRLAVSSGGKGRTEMIQMVSAGGQVTDAYYDRGGPQADYAVEDEE